MKKTLFFMALLSVSLVAYKPSSGKKAAEFDKKAVESDMAILSHIFVQHAMEMVKLTKIQ